MLLIQQLKTLFADGSNWLGRERLRRHLLGLSDRTLEDAGFSRELLESGADAWPWRAQAEDHGVRPGVGRAGLANREIKQAVTELNAYSDVELADLGLARHQIEDAVRYGRPGYEGKLGHAA